ncbi:MAG: hypothetical protein JWQ63_3161 [Mucilaginibacter sp.]|jgi:hypothetical protein|nr:hypothetical protein [Mucilaginibacter sp.]
MKPLSFLLVILVFASGFIQPPAMHMKMSDKMSCMMNNHANKGGCNNKSKQNADCPFCNYCVICITFIVPVKPGIQRHFVSGLVNYPEMVQSKLTDFNSSLWRPPNA